MLFYKRGFLLFLNLPRFWHFCRLGNLEVNTKHNERLLTLVNFNERKKRAFG
jgi:hypothetical protein